MTVEANSEDESRVANALTIHRVEEHVELLFVVGDLIAGLNVVSFEKARL